MDFDGDDFFKQSRSVPMPFRAEDFQVSAGNRLIDKIIEQLNEEEAQERQREADGARPVAPPTGGYRSAPLACRRAPRPAPRASWWRRLWHRGVSDRLDVRRRRHALRGRYPWAEWRDLHKLAGLHRDIEMAPGDDAVLEIFDATTRAVKLQDKIEADMTRLPFLCRIGLHSWQYAEEAPLGWVLRCRRRGCTASEL